MTSTNLHYSKRILVMTVLQIFSFLDSRRKDDSVLKDLIVFKKGQLSIQRILCSNTHFQRKKKNEEVSVVSSQRYPDIGYVSEKPGGTW